MIIVTGTKRSGTSLWMHILIAAGLPFIGERFPAGWGELLRDANPDGFFESELIAGVYYRTNPHPQTGAYLAPAQTREHAVKVFIPGLIRTDVAFIDRCIATVRSWREYVQSTRRLRELSSAVNPGLGDGAVLPPALEWWCSNYALVRDIAIRPYAAHVLSYDSLLDAPEKVANEVIAWLGRGDATAATGVVRPGLETRRQAARVPAHELADGIPDTQLGVFDELYDLIHRGRPLDDRFIESLNHTNEQLRPLVLEHQAKLNADTIVDALGLGE